MGDTRIDSSNPRTFSECDEETGLCGEVKKPEPQVSKAEPQVSHPGDDWHAPMLPQEKPAEIARIAKNMSAPKPPTHTELLATYDKMTDTQLEEALKPLQTKLQTPSYAGAAEDMEKFKAIEQVMGNRNAAIENEKHKDDDAWRVPIAEDGFGLGEQGALKTTKHVSFGVGSANLGLGHTGIQGTTVHAHDEGNLGRFELSGSFDGPSAGYDHGIHNNDGSWGYHGGGGASLDSVEGTVHKPGVGSVTVGLSAGVSAQYSLGFKKDGDTTEVCGKVDLGPLTVGACLPFAGKRM